MITERQGKILASVVYEYTKSGEPVSSSLIASKHYPEVSSATIRNEMLDLEKKVFLLSLIFQLAESLLTKGCVILLIIFFSSENFPSENKRGLKWK